MWGLTWFVLQVVGQLGMWGFIICMSQAAGLEHKDWMVMNWDGAVSTSISTTSSWSQRLTGMALVGLIVAFTAAMLILYTVAPILYRMASSTFYNISLLASNFYGLLFGEHRASLSVKPPGSQSCCPPPSQVFSYM